MKSTQDGSSWIAWNDEQRFTHQGKTVVIPEGTFAARDVCETHAKFWANQIAKDRARMEAMSWRNQ